MSAAVPCRRPKVTVDPHPSGVAGADQATCHVPGCSWTYTSVKTACEQAAVRHRGEHRDAVPAARVFGPDVNIGYHAECACGWKSGRGCVTRTDNDMALAAHLHAAHGLVIC